GTRDGAGQLPGQAGGELILLRGRSDEGRQLLERLVAGAEQLGRLLGVALRRRSLPQLTAQGGEHLPELLADLGRGIAIGRLLDVSVDRVEPAGDCREAGLRREDAALHGIARVVGAEVAVGADERGAGEAGALGARLDAIARVVVVAGRDGHLDAEAVLAR